MATARAGDAGEAVEPPVRAVLFDFGHTLVDFRRTEEALHEAYEQIRGRIEAAAYMEVPEILDLIERVAGGVDRLVGRSYEERRLEELDLAQTFRETLAGIGFDLPDDVLQHVVALDHSAYSNSLHAEPEVLETLAQLRASGYRLGLVSNIALDASRMREDLARLGIAEHLDASVFSSEVGVRKPDPRIFLETLARVGVAPADAVFVGDRLRDDVAGARAVGMRTVLTRQFRAEDDAAGDADAVIDRLEDLPSVLERWRGSLQPAIERPPDTEST